MHTAPSGTKESQLHTSTPTPPNSPLHVISGYASDEDSPGDDGFVPDADTYEAAITEPNEYYDASFIIDMQRAENAAKSFLTNVGGYETLRLQRERQREQEYDIIDEELLEYYPIIKDCNLPSFLDDIQSIAPKLIAEGVLDINMLRENGVEGIRETIAVLAKRLAQLLWVNKEIDKDDYEHYKKEICTYIRYGVPPHISQPVQYYDCFENDQFFLFIANMTDELYSVSQTLCCINPSVFVPDDFYNACVFILGLNSPKVLQRKEKKGNNLQVEIDKINSVLMRYGYADVALPMKEAYKTLLSYNGSAEHIPVLEVGDYQPITFNFYTYFEKVVEKIHAIYSAEVQNTLTTTQEDIVSSRYPMRQEKVASFKENIKRLLSYCRWSARYLASIGFDRLGSSGHGGPLVTYYYLKDQVDCFIDSTNIVKRFGVLGRFRKVLSYEVQLGHLQGEKPYFHLLPQLKAIQARLPFALLRRSVFNGNNKFVAILKNMNCIRAIYRELLQDVSRFKKNLKRFGFVGIRTQCIDYNEEIGSDKREYKQDIWVQPLLHLMVRVKLKYTRVVTFGIVKISPLSSADHFRTFTLRKSQKSEIKYLIDDKSNELFKFDGFSLFPGRHKAEKGYDPQAMLNYSTGIFASKPLAHNRSISTSSHATYLLSDKAHIPFSSDAFSRNTLRSEDTYFELSGPHGNRKVMVKSPSRVLHQKLTIPYDKNVVDAALRAL